MGQNSEDDHLLAEYFAERLKAEEQLLTGGEAFNLPAGVSLSTVAPNGINSADVLDDLLSHNVDTLAVFGTGILKELLLSQFEGRIVNIHLGVSPHYRGSGTNFWALYNEDLHLAGATIHYIDPGIDTGDIICHAIAPIVPDDTPHTIGNKIIMEAVEAIIAVFKLLEHGPVKSTPQRKPENERVYRRRDFDADVLRDLLLRWDAGLVNRFLEPSAKGQLEPVALVPLPTAAVTS